MLIRDQKRTLEEIAHRPWPLPRGPWSSRRPGRTSCSPTGGCPRPICDGWCRHELPIDTLDGSGWIGIVPFVLRGLRPPLALPTPWPSEFPELNVRTYVTVGGRPGVYFFSLDAASALAVFAARRTYRLPYFRAAMSVVRRGDRGRVLERTGIAERRAGRLSSALRAPRARRSEPSGSSLEYFLTERYCLYTVDGRCRIHRAEIHHPPWRLQIAGAELKRNTMTGPLGISLSGEPVLHFAARQDVLTWPRRRVRLDSGESSVRSGED